MALTDTSLSSRWLSAEHCTRGGVLTLHTAVHVVRPCGYDVTTVDALRSTAPTLFAWFGRSVCSHHIWTLSFSFSVCLLPCLCLIPKGGSTALDSCQVVHVAGSLLVSWHPLGYIADSVLATVSGSVLFTFTVHCCRHTVAALKILGTYNLHTDVCLVSGRLHTDSSAEPHSSSGCFFPGDTAQCCVQGRLHTTLLLRVLRTEHPLQGPTAATHSSSPTQGHRHHQQSQQYQQQQWSHSSPSYTALLYTTSTSRTWGTDTPGNFTQHPFKSSARSPPCEPWPLLPRRVHRLHLSFRPFHSPRSVPPKWEHIPLSTGAHKRSASAALAGIHPAICAEARAGRGPFPRPMRSIIPMVRFGLPNHLGMATSTMQTLISCIINTVS